MTGKPGKTALLLPLMLLSSLARAQAWETPRMPWGDPDLQGVWSNATITTLERPDGLDGLVLSEEQARELERRDAWYRLALVRHDGARVSLPALEVAGVVQRTGLDAVYEAAPGGDIHVRFHVGTATSRLQIGVYDVRGRLRRVLVDAPRDPGEYLLAWDRRDGSGAAMGSGIYVVSLRSPDARGTRKVVLVGH